MDQGGKRRNQVDTAVMSVIRRQRGSSTASCAGLQSRQFSAHAGDAGADQGVVADEPEGKADQDRREDRQPWPLCRVSDGRSRHSQKSLCRHSADDRGTAAATTFSAGLDMLVTMKFPEGCASGFQGAEPTGLPPHSTHWYRHGLAEPEPPIKGLALRFAGLWVVRASSPAPRTNGA